MTTFVGCQEEVSRRWFLKATAALSFAALPGLTRASTPLTDGRLLVLLLRGGLDGLYAVPPIGDSGLRNHRKDLVDQNLLPLDGFFSLHPAMKKFHGLYQNGQALVVHGTSIPYFHRSHFEGQNMMEGGMDAPYASTTGWLGRALDAAGLPAVTMSLPIPLILRGRDYADSSYPSFMLRPVAEVYDLLQQVWATDQAIAPLGKALVDEVAHTRDQLRDESEDTSIDKLAAEAGKRMAAANGPHIAVIDDFGYDTHSKEASQTTNKLKSIDYAIDSFARELGPDLWSKSLVLTVTEFGRTVAENGAWGTDHGYGTCVFAAGGLLKKSGVVADWPGLKPNNLFEGRDLRPTIDARALYGSAVSTVLGLDPDLVRKTVIGSPRDDRFGVYL